MSISDLRRAEADDATLLRRARRGDRRAHRIYGRRHAARAVELVELVAGDADSAALASQVLSAVVADGVAGDDALVRCAVRVTAPFAPEQGLARLVVALTDGDGRSEEEVAELIGRSVADVAELRADAYSAVGPAPVVVRECRGWPLVARRERVTSAERAAADGHLALCRQCRGRLDAQRQTRDKIWARGGAVSAVVVADVVSLSLPAGGAVAGSIASVALGKAGMAILGATVVAVTATSAGVAVARQAPAQPHRTQNPVVGPQHRGGPPVKAPSSRPGGDARTGSRSGAAASDSPSPASRLNPVPGAEPSAVPTAVPTIPPPTISAPVQLPTTLPTLLPLPSVSVSLAPLPLSDASPLLGR